MEILDCKQGDEVWLAERPRAYCASEASPMLGLSKRLTRNELLHMRATGAEKEFSEWVKKNLLEKGHAVEAAARVKFERETGDDLYPITGVEMVDGMRFLASFDGLTDDESLVWECKMWNAELAVSVREGHIPDEFWPQLEQQLLVSGAKKAVFTVTDGEDREVRFAYTSKPARRKQLIAGWKQFREDLANYKPVEVIPAAVAEPIRDLPALAVQISGQVTASNLPEWRAIVTARIEAIKTDLKDDQDFADAAKMVTFLDDGEKRIALVKAQAQAQATSIDEVFRALDDISATMRAKRMELDKLVASRKETIRYEILNAGKKALADHIAALNTRMGKPWMPDVPADFAGAMKGKRTLESLRNGVDTVLANAKIAANETADKIHANINLLREHDGYGFLFNDAQSLAQKAPDDFALVVTSRINQHKAAEKAKEEAQRERIRQEEAARLQAEQQAKEAADRRAREEVEARERREREAADAAERARAQAELDAERRARETAESARKTAEEKLAALPVTRGVSIPDLAGRDPAPRAAVQLPLDRPSDDQLIGALALRYGEEPITIIEWLRGMNLDAAAARLLQTA